MTGNEYALLAGGEEESISTSPSKAEEVVNEVRLLMARTINLFYGVESGETPEEVAERAILRVCAPATSIAEAHESCEGAVSKFPKSLLADVFFVHAYLHAERGDAETSIKSLKLVASVVPTPDDTSGGWPPMRHAELQVYQ